MTKQVLYRIKTFYILLPQDNHILWEYVYHQIYADAVECKTGEIKLKKKKIIVSVMVCFLLAASIFFMGKGEAQAAGNYYLQVNKGTNVVTVFQNDGTPVKAFVCSTGYATPIGTFYTSQKLRWHVLDGPSYGQYCTRITGSILFHSVWYYRNGDYNSQSYREYNKLGTTASHGCVRLTVADAKWIYDNCPLRTKVVVIYGSAANDALGKPDAIKVNAGQFMGWDPTDPMTGNPYNGAMPSIQTNGSVKKLSYKSKFQPFEGISAKDSLGNDITGKLTYSGKVNTKKLGSYKITYAVTDALGRSAYADVKYKVADTKKAVIKGVKKSQTKEYKSAINLKSKIKAYTVTGKNLTRKIKIKIVYPGSKKEKTYTKSTLKLTKLGTYRINYYVTNPNNKKVTKVTGKIIVKDTKKPKLYGISSRKTVEYYSTRNLKSKVSAKLVSGKNLTSKITIQVKEPGQRKYKKLSSNGYKKYKFKKTGTYTVMYSVTNPYNKKAVAKKSTIFTVRDTKAPKLYGVTSKRTLEYNSVQNLKSRISAKLLSGKSMTSSIVVRVKTPEANTYRTLKGSEYARYRFSNIGTYAVEYSVTNPGNRKAVARKTTLITVRDTKAPVISGVSQSMTVDFGAKQNLRTGVTAKLLSGRDITSTMRIYVTTPDNVTSVFGEQEYVFSKAGNYKVVYTAVNTAGNRTTQISMNVLVRADVRQPQITVDSSKASAIELNTPYDVFDGVTAVLPDYTPVKNITARITGVDESDQPISNVPVIGTDGIVTFQTAGSYMITYTAQNPNNPLVSVSVDFTVTVTAPTVSATGIDAEAQASEPEIDSETEAETSEPEIDSETEPETDSKLETEDMAN